MLGKKRRREPMFYYVRMEETFPENHLLRLVDKHIDLSFIRDKVKHLYSHTGRPSIVPKGLLRMLLIGYLYRITSERRLCEEVQMHIGYRRFVGLSLEDKVPDHSSECSGVFFPVLHIKRKQFLIPDNREIFQRCFLPER